MNLRLERVAQLIRDEIAQMLRRDIHDPLIGFVTITDVEVSSDLRHAKVFFSVLGDEEQVKNSIKGLLRARKYMNARLSETIELRYIPKLRFIYDETAVKAQRMAEALQREHETLAPTLEAHAAEEAAAVAAEAGAAAAEEEPDEDEDWDEEDDLDDEDFDEDEEAEKEQ
ncbi:MAG: 30S ribosome-binding factor RbfA [Armatimonadia bacterium]